MIYKDATILNSIRNYVANSMQSEMFTTAQLAALGNTNHDLEQLNPSNIKYITCGISVCGSSNQPILQFVKRS